MTADSYRLPSTVIPLHYTLALAPDLDDRRFEGNATIDIVVQEPTNRIVLNAAELDILTAFLDAREGRVELDEDRERMTVMFTDAISAGPHTLTVAYSGTLNDDLRGFYRSTFGDQVIATTQFESTDARRAFPCWDEPEFKATFDVSLLVPDGMIGLSNGAAVADRPTEGGMWVTFERTMKMSTYLVAFIVGPLVTTPPVDVDGTPLRVACVRGKEHLTAFALEVGAHALRFFADYFGIPYPAGKLDMVALPDFAFGAMENLGCITYRETALLIDPANASRVELERIADVVCHEIAHMWFGDLVTMRWWNGIWLNEAFATFMEIAAVDAFRPDWERWVSFSTERASAMQTDGLEATRPIEYEVVSPADAEGMFDVLTYQKGGAVLRMLETYLGTNRFREGIRLYLRTHSYGNTETTDLWDAIEEATGEPVRAIMDSWILQGGHPLVTASQDGGRVTLSQELFRYQGGGFAPASTWQVPVLLRPLDSGEHARTLLTGPSASLAFEAGTAVVNAGGWGTFRTRYSPDLFATLTGSLKKLTPIERFNLVSDTWALTLAGMGQLSEFLDLVRLLGASDERTPAVWEAALLGMDLVHRYAPSVSSRVRAAIGPLFHALGWSGDPVDDKLRGLLVEALGTIGDDEEVMATALRYHSGDHPPLAPDLAGPIVTTVAWEGSAPEYETFWDRIRGASTPQEEIRYITRLGSFRDPSLVERSLDAVLDDLRSQNGALVISTALGNRWCGREAWTWLVEHWDDVIKRLPHNGYSRMLGGVVYLTDQTSLTVVPAWLADHPIPNAPKQVAQLLERQQVNAAFAARTRQLT